MYKLYTFFVGCNALVLPLQHFTFVLKRILFWLTAGGFGIWYVVDIVMILLDVFTDKQGRKLRK